MEIFLRVIQGAYAYLLIFLIAIVSTLFLTLLWLIVKRTKEAAMLPDLSTETAGLGVSPAVQTAVTEMVAAGPPVNQEELNQLKAENEKQKKRIELLESDLKATSTDAERVKSLGDKVQFLESKLLEYEILQEEISTLSALKLENERLKQRMVKAGLAVSDTGAGLTEVEPAPSQSAPETSPAEQPVASPEPLVVKIPGDGAAVASSPSGVGETDNLDSLLAEIDKLTASPQP